MISHAGFPAEGKRVVSLDGRVVVRLVAMMRLQQRVCAGMVAAAMFLGAAPVATAAPDQSEIERLYVEGQQRNERKDFEGAAESWTRLLNLLPESGDNQAVRETVIINVLDAHLKAYNQLVDGAGKKDPKHLRAGKQTLDSYYADFKAVYGDRMAVSAAVQEKAAELEAALEKAEAEAAVPPPSDPTPPPIETYTGGDQSDQDVVVVNRQNSVALLASGAVVAALGIAAIAMIPIGVVRVNDAEERWQDANARFAAAAPGSTERSDASFEQQQAEFDGNQGEAIWISGAVLAPLLLGGGAALIVFGVKAHKANQRGQARIPTLAPSFTRTSVGFGLSGRF